MDTRTTFFEQFQTQIHLSFQLTMQCGKSYPRITNHLRVGYNNIERHVRNSKMCERNFYNNKAVNNNSLRINCIMTAFNIRAKSVKS